MYFNEGLSEKKGKNSFMFKNMSFVKMLFIFDLFLLHVVSSGSSLDTYVHTEHLGSSLLNVKLSGVSLLT